MSILSASDWRFWRDNGYVVIHEAVPAENLAAAVNDIWEFLGMDRKCPDDWYREPLCRDGMVGVYQTQALWDNRQHPRVYGAFAELLARPDLWVSVDQSHMKPPVRADKPGWDHSARLHWDLDTSLPVKGLRLQGVLYLTDTAENQGGFQCVPGFHLEFDNWARQQPAERDPRHPDLADRDARKVAGAAGDLIIWNALLPHGHSRNLSSRPRLAQYIGMFPAKPDNQTFRERRIRMWRERLSPIDRNLAQPGGEVCLRRDDGPPAVLTELGAKLLGLKSWR